MKPLFFTLSALAFSLYAWAGEPTDTVVSVSAPQSVKIITRGNTQTIIIKGSIDDPEYSFTYVSEVGDSTIVEPEELWVFNPIFAKQKRRKAHNPEYDMCSDIYAGAVIPTAYDKGINRVGWEIGMLNAAQIKWRISQVGTSLSVGIGWQYSHLTIGEGMMPQVSEKGILTLIPFPEEFYYVKGSLKSFAVQFPVLLTQKIYKSFNIELGGVAMLNTYTAGTTSWKEGNVSTKESIKHLHQRILTVDAIARIGWRDICSFYVRYSPMSQFKDQFGPEYKSISVGLTLGF